MGFIGKMLFKNRDFLLRVYGKKTAISVGKFVASWIVGSKAAPILVAHGANLDPMILEGLITAGLLSVLKYFEDNYGLNKQEDKEIMK